MTCKEVHAYWETEPCAAIKLQPVSAELADHVASCPECNRFIEEQTELARSLYVVRDSAPVISTSVEGAVLTRYRAYLSEQSRSPVPVSVTGRVNLRRALDWALVAGFALIVAYGATLLLAPRQRSWVDRQPTAWKPVPQAESTANKQLARREESAPRKRKSVATSTRRVIQPARVARQGTSLPTRFQSLMYCDQISCPDAMDVIRVQLPSPVLGRSAGANGLVSADVLVGSDGIARGIRIVD